MKIHASQSLIALSLVMGLAACGPKLQSVSENQGDGTSDPDAAGSTRETVTVGVNVQEKGVGFKLASANSFNMSLVGCASGLTQSNITQANPSIDVYKFDQGCLVQLNSFVMGGITYTPASGDPFGSYAPGDIATFEEAANPANKYTVVITSQLSSPISGQEAVSYTFTQLAAGTDEAIAKSVVGDSHSLSVSGQDAPNMDIVGVTMNGMTAGGAGQFIMKIECLAAITGTTPNFNCGTNLLTSMKYKLVKDTYGSVLTAAQAAAIFDGSESSVTAPDLLALASSGAPNGGFNTSTVTGPAVMHNNPNMLFVIKAGASYKYFNVDVSTLTYP